MSTHPFQPDQIHFSLPSWVEPYCTSYRPTQDLQQRMAFVVAASRMNVENGSGGPFAAAIFEQESGVLVSLGVNRVTPEGLSMLHAEMVAISLAQKKLGHYDLGAESLPRHELVSSTEPCAMCLGAIPWSGVMRLACAARAEDAEAIGFDEGAKPPNWQTALMARRIEVAEEVEREQAVAVLQAYHSSGGLIYNGRD